MTVTVHHNPHAEDSVLGAILLTGTPALERATTEHGLKPQHFHRPSRGLIYQAMLHLADNGHGIDHLTVTSHLRATNQLDQAGGPAEVEALTAAAPVIGHIGTYCDEVIRCHRWHARQAANHREADAIAAEDDDAYTAARSEGDRAEPDRGETLDGPALLARYRADRAAGDRRLISLPWPALNDAMFGGARPGDTTLISGYSSMGKSVAAAQWCEHAADQGLRVAVYSNEMQPQELAARFVAGRCSLSFGTIMRDQLTPDQQAEHDRTLEALPLSVVPIFGWPWPEIARHIRSHKWDLACLDLFSRLPSIKQTNDEDDAINGLCNAAAQAGSHLVVVTQLAKRRTLDGRLDPPSRAEVRGSGMLWNSPNNVLYVHQDQEQNPAGTWDLTGRGLLWADKIRGGAPGSRSGTRVELDPDRMRFVDGDAWRGREAVAEAVAEGLVTA